MAEVEIVSPLYETGVHHATVRSPMAGTPPDPLPYLPYQPLQPRGPVPAVR